MLSVQGGAVTLTQKVAVCPGTTELEVSAYFLAAVGTCKGTVCIGGGNNHCGSKTGISSAGGWTTVTGGFGGIPAGTAELEVSVTITCQNGNTAGSPQPQGYMDWVVLG